MYDCVKEKEKMFTENGIKHLLKILKKSEELLNTSGAFKASNIITGDIDLSLACLDFLSEIGYLREVTSEEYAKIQDRIYVEGDMGNQG